MTATEETTSGRGEGHSGASDPDFMASFARGLAVLQCFAEQEKPLSVSEASALTGFSRGSVRRCLHTLGVLGLAEQRGSRFGLLPGVLRLGYAYLSSNALAVAAQPMLDRLSTEHGESFSLGVRDGNDVCYIARSEVSRIISVALHVGSRLPLYYTSMGRVLLAHMPAPECNAHLAQVTLTPRTPTTITDPGQLAETLVKIREQGFALVDQELELGLRSLAIPVFARNGTVVAAINIGTQSARMSSETLLSTFRPLLETTARELENYIVP